MTTCVRRARDASERRCNSRASSSRTRIAGGRVAKALGPDGDARRARGDEVERVAARAGCRPSRRPAASVAAATSRGHRERHGADRRARTDPRSGAQPRRCPMRGSIAVARSVLISDSASAPPSCAARATGADVRDVGRQLHDQRLGGQRADPRHERRHLRRLGAHHAARLDVRAGHVQLERGDLAALGDPLAPGSRTRRARTRPRSRSAAPAGSPAPAGRAPGSPARPLFGRPIELIRPAGVSHRRGGGLPPRGRERDRLRDEGREGEALAQTSSPKVRSAAIASNVPEPFRTGCSSSTPARSTRRSTAGGAVTPGVQCQSSSRSAARTTGPSTHSRRNPVRVARRSRSRRRSRTPCLPPARAAPRRPVRRRSA